MRVTAGALPGLDFARGVERAPAGAPAAAEPRALLAEACAQLQAYFAGDRLTFDLPLRPPGSAFRKRVWRALRDIPFGETRTYGAVATAVGSAPRAVGGACKANPIAIVIPCHRVVGAAGWIGGFSGGAGCATKRQLLDHEAAILAGGR